MPQMMPINWIMLFFFFSLIYIMFLIMNFYNFKKINIKKINFFSKKKNNLNWKW